MSKIFYKAVGKTQTWPELYEINPSSLTYDDVLIVPQISKTNSRSDIDISITFGPFKLTKPIISSPMDTITGEKMARTLAENGAISAYPRGNIEKSKEIAKQFANESLPCVFSVGLKNGMSDARELVQNGAKMILVDVAHGGLTKAVELGEEIKTKLKVSVIVGNIVTYDEAMFYKKNKIDIAKVGVGPGGLCSTRLVAGTGFPQLSAIFDTTSAQIPVIADGGIKKSADFAKAVAAGASMVMIGSLFGGTDETPGDFIDGHKTVRGQASKEYMKDNGVSTGEYRTAEGVSTKVQQKGSVINVLEELMGGLRSAISYSNSTSISEFQKKAIFVKVSRATLNENIPWLAYNKHP